MKRAGACPLLPGHPLPRYFVVGAVSVLVEDEVLLFVLELVLGALEPPAALESLPLCFFAVDPLLD